MKLFEIELDNFRGIQHTKIQLDGRSAIIYGINGAGKTSVLNAITIVMSKVLSEASWEDGQVDVENISVDDIHIGAVDSKIELGLEYKGEITSVFRKRDEESIKKSRNIELLAKKMREQVGRVSEEGSSSVLTLNNENMPIFVNYGINRLDRANKTFKKEKIL